MNRKIIIAYIGVASFAVVVGFLIGINGEQKILSPSIPENYPLLANRLFVDNPSEKIINFTELRTSLNNYVSENNLKGSVYFEYLPTGTSIRINGNEKFRAASLMKLPVAMEVYKAAELGLIDLDQEIELKEEWLNDGFGDLYKKGAGYKITMEEIVKILLTESDNTALRAAIATTDEVLPLEERALGSLDVELSVADNGAIDIGTRSYSSFLKCLYFACYNSNKHSNIILEHLTQSKFDNRIVAGAPDGAKVAHKIGVFNTNVQSDCGIIYRDNGDYQMCIMLVGQDNPEINQHFANLSKITSDFFKTLDN